jgi:methyl-accepting chemotaxis protein
MKGPRTVNLHGAAATIFALTAILPLLLFVFFLWYFDLLGETMVQVGLGLALLVALLGFVIFQRLAGRISELVDALRAPTAQTAPLVEAATTAVPGLGEVSEIGEIARSFGRMLEDLRTSTERLEDLVFKLGTLNELVELAT